MENIYKHKYDKKFRLNLEENLRIKKMAQIINDLNLEHCKILDYGCYDGYLLSLIKRKNELHGIEASEYGFRMSKKRGINVKKFFYTGDKLTPYSSNTFDLVVAGEIIEHVIDTEGFLLEISRLLKKNGLLVLTTPNIASLGRRLFLLMGKNPHIEFSVNEPDSSGHLRYFTHDTIKYLLKKTGFSVELALTDTVNFDNSGKINVELIGDIFPTLGSSIIVLAKKIRNYNNKRNLLQKK